MSPPRPRTRGILRARSRWHGLAAGVAALAALSCVSPRSAHADDDSAHRFGMVGLIGGGIAGVPHPGPLAGFIGFTDLGVELLGEVRPWGGFLRAEYLSSGDAGRWTAFAFSGGVEYRLFGNTHRTALFLRGGVAYERWMGNTAGCPIDLFVPNSCNLEGATSSSFLVSTDMIGVLAGARVEVPLSKVYLGFSANLVPTVAVDQGTPAGSLEARFTLELGFRDNRTRDVVDRPRRPWDGTHRKRDVLSPEGD